MSAYTSINSHHNQTQERVQDLDPLRAPRRCEGYLSRGLAQLRRRRRECTARELRTRLRREDPLCDGRTRPSLAHKSARPARRRNSKHISPLPRESVTGIDAMRISPPQPQPSTASVLHGDCRCICRPVMQRLWCWPRGGGDKGESDSKAGHIRRRRRASSGSGGRS